MKDKLVRNHHETPCGQRSWVSAIFGVVANFAGSPEEKLKAVIRAGTIAEAFLSGTSDGTTSPHDGKVFEQTDPLPWQTGQRRTAG